MDLNVQGVFVFIVWDSLLIDCQNGCVNYASGVLPHETLYFLSAVLVRINGERGVCGGDLRIFINSHHLGCGEVTGSH
jgi:hypothetical protein